MYWKNKPEKNNKYRGNQIVAIRLSKQLLERIDAAAKTAGVTRSYLIKFVLEKVTNEQQAGQQSN